MKEITEDLHRERLERELEEMVKVIWNGRSVLRHFGAEGPQIGRLVRLGQDYVRSKLTCGERITEDLVRNYLLDADKKSMEGAGS
jgi:hypothetical protein